MLHVGIAIKLGTWQENAVSKGRTKFGKQEKIGRERKNIQHKRKPSKVHQVGSDENSEEESKSNDEQSWYVHRVKSKDSSEEIIVNVNLEENDVEMELDADAPHTLMPLQQFKKLFPLIKLKKTDCFAEKLLWRHHPCT